MLQATEQAPIKPSQASRNSRGQVDLDNLSSDDLDYGCDVEGLASLRKRLKHAIGSYNGASRLALLSCLRQQGDEVGVMSRVHMDRQPGPL